MAKAKRVRRQIKRHLPSIGTSLVGEYKGQEYQAIIVEARRFPEGRAVKLDNILYRSLTAAAVTVTKQSTNGWLFWKIVE